jgi:GxxExxY protein
VLNIPSPLTEEQETLVERTIGRCTNVHKALGPGLLENIYSRAIALELTAAAIPFEREK